MFNSSSSLAVAGYGFEPRHARPFLLLVFGALGRKTQRAQTGGLCAVELATVAGLGAGRASLFLKRFS